MEVQELEKIIRQQEMTNASTFKVLMRKVYLWMTLALMITGITAAGVANSPNILALIYSSQVVMWGIIIAEFGLVIYISARLEKLSLSTATTLFALYSILNGVMLSSIFLLYSTAIISKVFFITAGTFGVTALYGYATKKDLSSLGNILFMALIGLVIATIVNVFMKSAMFDLILSYIGVIIFVGLTAWDSQKIKHMMMVQQDADESAQKLALIGALSLYLDFINLFLYLLRIFGRSND
ncbi:integral membrane protein interacts with FtsH [Prevotella sp. CAG:1092]|nr:Bax inhibitor-1/YccA family protein [Prevotella sp.]MDD7707974.1 Bax inhibitor-1/YccA family protein [Prevotella sp.]MDY4150368.1 Bax inhibitor-1/YccA family protein [Prevotella sp.]CCZ11020.1 integral membrane protein interacts with FtsH [Prevotella sp. CAG:1092]